MKKMYKAIISIALALSMILQLGAASVCAVENNPPVVPSEEDASGVSIVKLQTEFMDNPLGIDIESPRLSWQMKSSAVGQKQTAYQLFVADSAEKLAAGPYVWDSGKMENDQSVDIRYGGKALEPCTRYYWKVKVWDKDGTPVESTEEAYFETGLLVDDWENEAWGGAKWIASPSKADPSTYPDETEKSSFTVEADVMVPKVSDPGWQSWGSVGLVWGYNDRMRTMYDVRLSFDFTWDRIFVYNEYRAISATKNKDGYDERINLDDQFSQFKPSTLAGKKIHLKVEVEGPGSAEGAENSVFKTYINDTLVMTHTSRRQAKGLHCGFGFFHERNESQTAYADNLKVTDADGNIVMEEDFSDPCDTVFGEQFVDVVKGDEVYYADDEFVTEEKDNGWLRINGCTIATPTAYSDEVAPMFRKEFSADKGAVKSARLYTSAAGIYDYYINGQKVNDSYFNPGNTAYRMQTDYQTYDVTELVKTGGNAIGAYLGHGWYDRAYGYELMTMWGDYLALLGKLVITYESGEQEIIVTDGTWKVYEDGPIRANDFWQGEVYDARKEVAGWAEPGFTGEGWTAAAETGRSEYYADQYGEKFDTFHKGMENGTPMGLLTAQSEPPIRVVKTLEPVNVDKEAKAGTIVYDFGQEFTGICRVTVKGKAGDVITLRHGEWLNEEKMNNVDNVVGTVWTRNLLGAQATDRYILKGDAAGEVFEPGFTFHGFRYMEIFDIPESVEIVKVEGLALSSDLETTGSYECSNENVNQLVANAMWSQIDNFIGIPVDCPQRSERYGWTGDAEVYSRSGSYNANVEAFYANFVKIMQSQQYPDHGNMVGDIVPAGGWGTWGQNIGNDSNIWSDAMVIIPWNLYQQYGSTAIIERAWDGMKGWTDRMIKTSEEEGDQIWRKNEAYGDHLSLESYENSKEVVNTAYAAHVCDIMGKMAEAINDEASAAKYKGYFEKYKNTWNAKWVRADGTTGNASESNNQTFYALGLQFNLYPESMREKAGEKLLANIKHNNYHGKAGFAGIAYLNPALTATGNAEAAYKIMEQEDYPSWMYSVTKGATTIWEMWNAYEQKEDGTHSIHGSLNHFSYGSFTEWLYRYSAGIERDEANPGFKHTILQPTMGGTFTHAGASYDSVYGTIESKWTAKGGELLTYDASVPANTTATLYLPITKPQADVITVPEGATFDGMVEYNGHPCAKYTLESGTYAFKNYSAANAKDLEEQANAAKKEAEEAQKRAEEAQKKAEEEQKKAEEAKKEAEEALKKVQEAQKKAEEAQKAAEEAKKQAEEKAQEAANSQTATEQQRKEAQAAKEQAQAAQNAANAAKAESSAAKKELEAARAQLAQAQADAKAAKDAVEKLNFQGKKVTLSKVASSKKKQAKATWKKVSGAEGYQVQYAMKSNFKNKKTLTVKDGRKTSAVIKKLRSGKKYYVRVRAYRKIGGKTVYTAFGNKKNARVK